MNRTDTSVKYVGTSRTGHVHRIEGRERRRLNPRRDLLMMSSSSLSWGHAGRGPAQLALALCADALGDDDRALAVYEDFQWAVVAKLGLVWVITRAEIVDVVERLEQGRAAG